MSESDESNMPPFIGLAQPRPEFLPCGHHHSLMLKSAETGEPSYCELCDCIGRRNDFETELNETKAFVAALQGLHAGDVETLRAEAANALYMVRADKAQALMEVEKAMAQIREATAKVVKERDSARAEAAALKADAERYRWLRIQPFDKVRDMFALYGTDQQRDAAINEAKESGNG